MDGGRARLRQLSGRLVALHAGLLARERLAYEAAHGPADAAELLRQVIHHEQFAWLRSLVDDDRAGRRGGRRAGCDRR